MYEIRFIFWESLKALGLAFLGLLAVKATSGWASQRRQLSRSRPVEIALYAIILVLAILGARSIGYDATAELYRWTSENDMKRSDMSKAYANAMRAVLLRAASIANWRTLATAKLKQRQFESLLDDMPAFRALAGGELDEQDAYRFAVCYFYLGQYDKLIAAAERLIERNRAFAAPYVLQGMAYTALGKHAEAEGSFLAVFQLFPNNQAAVEGLAHEYFLAGKRDRAQAVLDQTAKFRFPPETRARFEALKQVYAQ